MSGFKNLFSVLHVSYAVSKQTASFRIHTELNKTINSLIFVAHKSISSNSIIQPNSISERISARFGLLREFIFSKLLPHNRSVYFSYNFGIVFIQKLWINKLFKFKTDLVHLHWIGNGFINIDLLQKFKSPLVITLHDVWFLTGGCHVNLGCSKFMNGCKGCPLFSSNLIDITSILFEKKFTFFQEKSVNIVVLSSWMKEIVLSSPILANCPVTLIPNGIDIDIYKPQDKDFARRVFNLNSKSKILLFGGISASSDFNKGYDLLSQSLSYLNYDENIELVIFGKSELSIEMIEGYKVTHIGHLSDDQSLALLYSAADLVLVPSRQESFSQVTLEAISCGTPVVAFDYSGPRDIIKHQLNGYLATPYDASDFANGISWALKELNFSNELSINAREIAVSNFDIKLISQKHVELYNSVIVNSK